jgi:hypothetical protein
MFQPSHASHRGNSSDRRAQLFSSFLFSASFPQLHGNLPISACSVVSRSADLLRFEIVHAHDEFLKEKVVFLSPVCYNY